MFSNSVWNRFTETQTWEPALHQLGMTVITPTSLLVLSPPVVSHAVAFSLGLCERASCTTSVWDLDAKGGRQVTCLVAGATRRQTFRLLLW